VAAQPLRPGARIAARRKRRISSSRTRGARRCPAQ
jgi:hypothetical protein